MTSIEPELLEARRGDPLDEFNRGALLEVLNGEAMRRRGHRPSLASSLDGRIQWD